MDIIVYRTQMGDVEAAFKDFIDLIQKSKFDVKVNIFKSQRRIEVNQNIVSFWCRDYKRMGGIRPKYYNTDSRLASEFLSQGASKVDGQEINNLEELLLKCIEDKRR